MPLAGQERGNDQDAYLDTGAERGCDTLHTDVAQNVRVHITCHTSAQSLNAVDSERVNNQGKERTVLGENAPDIFDVQFCLFIILLCLLLCSTVRR